MLIEFINADKNFKSNKIPYDSKEYKDAEEKKLALAGNMDIVQYYPDNKHAEDSYKYAIEAVRILDATLGDNDQWDLTTQNFNNITLDSC